MISLLPPDHKEQLRYSKLNRLVITYVSVLGVVVVVLGVVFGGALYLLNMQSSAITQDVAKKQAMIDSLNKTFTPKAKDASDRLAAIKFVQGSQTRFSVLIADLAKVIPQGVSINSMTLTGNDKTPVSIAVQADTYSQALAFRNAITTSPRVASADLESITVSSRGGYETSVVIAFKPGQAK